MPILLLSSPELSCLGCSSEVPTTFRTVFVSSNCFFFIDKMYLVARVIALQQQRQQQRSTCSVALPPLSQERSRSRNGKSGAHMSARASEDEKVVFDTCACASAEMNIYFLASFEMSAQARAGAQF